MENASNALIISGTILIAILVLSLGVILASAHKSVNDSYVQQLIQEEINKYNSHFIQFIDRHDITIQEIVTLNRYINSYKQEKGYPASEVLTEIQPANLQTTVVNEEADRQTIKDDAPTENNVPLTLKYYEVTDIQYNDEGRVSLIRFNKIEVQRPE